MKILSSATRVVLLLLTMALIAGLFTNKVSGQEFMSVIIMVVAYYFRPKNPVDKEDTSV
jgi:hypothetical protein